MKIIFSRKGLDSSFGAISSVVLPDGSLYWLPIPDGFGDNTLVGYSDINYLGINAETLIRSISGGKMPLPKTLHLDPDIYDGYVKRRDGWRAAFGQVGAAQSHLENEGVGVGDVFLFFAWFRDIRKSKHGYTYASGSDRHIIYGWLQVGEIIKPDRDIAPEWLMAHPHITRKDIGTNNTVYIAADSLVLDGKDTGLPAAGYFLKETDEIVLTEKGKNRTLWRLPEWAFPSNGKKPLSYHRNPALWQKRDGFVELKTVGRGQEFVLDCACYPEAEKWLERLISQQKGNFSASSDELLLKELKV